MKHKKVPNKCKQNTDEIEKNMLSQVDIHFQTANNKDKLFIVHIFKSIC